MLIDRLSTLHSPDGALVSLYLNHPTGPAAPALADLVKPLRHPATDLPRTTLLSLRADADRIAALDARIDADPSPAFCVFASRTDGIFEFHSLPFPVWDRTSIGRKPYLRPLRARPSMLRAGMVVAERRRAEVYVLNGKGLEPLGDPIMGETLKDNFGGFRGYEEHRASRHAEEAARRVLAGAAERLFEEHARSPLDYLSLGGHQAATEMILPHLHPYLRRLPIHTFVVDPHTMTPAELRQRATEQAEEVRRRREEELLGSILATLGAGGAAVAGTAPLLEAANAKAVEEMVVSGTFEKPGVACPGCGWLARSGDACPLCGSSLDATDDVVAAAMEAVIAAGGSVHQVAVASPLDAHGVAATLRFPLS